MYLYKKFSIVIVLVVILSLVLAGGVSAKPNDKVDVCHKTGNGSFHLISIKADDLGAHLAHGDGTPGQAVPGQAGKVFGADCSVASTAQNEQAQPSTTTPTTNQGKKASKVLICHKTGNGTYRLININGNAVPAHINNHGDGFPDDWVPNQPGKKFTSTCGIIEVPQKELVQTLSVLPTGETIDSMPLQTGQLYELIVSGTYIYDLEGDWADAEYFVQQDVIIKGDTEYPSFPNILDLSINGPSINQDWGVYQSTHIYTKEWTGNGEALSFAIYDSFYDDNVGSLTVEIWIINW